MTNNQIKYNHPNLVKNKNHVLKKLKIKIKITSKEKKIETKKEEATFSGKQKEKKKMITKNKRLL